VWDIWQTLYKDLILIIIISLYGSLMSVGQKPYQTKALSSKNDKADKSPPVKMTGQTKALP
jgi:hypothetical protein